MIKASELRVDNFVIYKIDGENKICQIEGITKEYVELRVVDPVDFLEDEIPIERCQPIPLTPEWLERCGFVYNAPFYTKRPLMLSKNTVRDGSGDYDGFILRIKIEAGMQHMVIKNLHHLQNIFHSFTGEELNVKL